MTRLKRSKDGSRLGAEQSGKDRDEVKTMRMTLGRDVVAGEEGWEVAV
jgi:hypothetical protein